MVIIMFVFSSSLGRFCVSVLCSGECFCSVVGVFVCMVMNFGVFGV